MLHFLYLCYPLDKTRQLSVNCQGTCAHANDGRDEGPHINATIFMPLTRLTEAYGMNFEYMPALYWRRGDPLTLLVIAAMGISVLLIFRKNDGSRSPGLSSLFLLIC